MALILVGQTELWDKLQMQSYTAIRQRIDIQCKIQPMDHSQVREYLKQPSELCRSRPRYLHGRSHRNDLQILRRLCEDWSTKSVPALLIYGSQNGKRIIDDHMVKLVISGELI